MRIASAHIKRRERSFRVAATITLLAAVAALATTPSPAHTAPVAQVAPAPAVPGVTYRVDPEVGVQFHGMWAFWTDDQRQSALAKLQLANIHTLSMDVSWAMLQPTNGSTFDPWGVGFVDTVIAEINAYGITPQIMFWITPGWANGNQGEYVPPTNPADYARAIQWAANRYAGKVASWQVWNEPNNPDFFVGANPVTYTNLVKAAYPAVKAGDPKALVVFGGIQYNDAPWIALCYQAGAKGYFDVMFVHAYQSPSDQSPLAPDNGTIWRFTHVVAVRNLMVAKGDSAKPIWMKTGYSTYINPPNTPPWALGVSEVTQAIFLNQAVNLIRAQWPWVDKFFWYSTIDEDVEVSPQNRHYGLLRADLSTKPAYTALYELTLPDGTS